MVAALNGMMGVNSREVRGEYFGSSWCKNFADVVIEHRRSDLPVSDAKNLDTEDNDINRFVLREMLTTKAIVVEAENENRNDT